MNLRHVLSSRTMAACLLAVAGATGLTGCETVPAQRAPLALAGPVDLPRFMGDWYVIAGIPTVFERGAHNPREQYRMNADGAVETTFSFEAERFGGPERQFTSKGYVLDGSGAVWGQQYVWPFKADYRIAYVSPDYRLTVIGREKRDYVWIMARTPTIADADYERLRGFIAAQGYDLNQLQKMPQQPR